MKTFKDFYKNNVKLSFADHPFSESPKHVWIVCRYKGEWLLTKHKERGIEFPGGKVEVGETAEEAAIREVYEETGGLVKKLAYVGQYYVDGKKDYVIKNVYYATIERLIEESHYHETNGPLLLGKLPADVKINPAYSFMMKDEILYYAIDFIKSEGWIDK